MAKRHSVAAPVDTPYTVSEAARVLNRSAQTVRRYIDSGKLPAQRTKTGQRIVGSLALERLRRELEIPDEAA